MEENIRKIFFRRENGLKILLSVYILSMILPIDSIGSPGYKGVAVSFSFFATGFNSLKTMFSGDGEIIHFAEIIESVWLMLLGLVNVFYILSFLLLIKGWRKGALQMSGICAITTLAWGIHFIRVLNIGYFLWLFSGIGLLLLSGREYKYQTGANTVQLLAGDGMIFTYIVLLIMMLRYIV